MSFVRAARNKPLKLQLRRDLVRSIKRGHAWVYADALREIPNGAAGSQVILRDNRGGREIARGFYDPHGAITLRIASTQRGETLDHSWAEARMRKALAMRKQLFDEETTGYRLFNGEGDGLPGLVCDIYGKAAVLKADGAAAQAFWNMEEIAQWLSAQLELDQVYERFREKGNERGRVLFGIEPSEAIPFVEHGLVFTADLEHGQKTGFFLDQRENRRRIQPFCEGKSILNVFGYTGGFSVYAGMAGASHVTTVDLAKPALQVAEQHWLNNKLDAKRHTMVAADAFEFLDEAAKQNQTWDVVVLDPPSFAPSKDKLPQARKAYQKLIAGGAQITAPGGVLAAASCSSHIDRNSFIELCEEGISKARRKAIVLGVHGQPADHPAPLVMRELHYLKFVLLQLD